ILYGAGDLINDYEGISGYEEFRGELSLIYLPRMSRSGELQSMVLLPMRMEHFRLNRPRREEIEFLRQLLVRESRGFSFDVNKEGLIVATPRPSPGAPRHPLPAAAGRGHSRRDPSPRDSGEKVP